MSRDYKKEYTEYHGTDAQKKRRAERNKSRKEAVKKGLVKKGDGKEVDHIGSNRTGSLANVPTRVVAKKTNRKKQPKRS